MKKILVYVQHLLGIGHLHRTSRITQALAANGFRVTVVSGGLPEAKINFGSVELVQLAPIKTDSSFTNLYDIEGNIINDEFKQQRCEKLLSIYKESKPDLVLIETYPFGRRQMRFELLPLLKEIQSETPNKPLVASSIRDVIQPKTKRKRVDEIVDIVSDYFDAIFVHGDKSFIPFEQSFPQAIRFLDKLYYTGYVTKNTVVQTNPARQKNKLLVSAGGGAVGQKLYQTCLNAAKQSQGLLYQWHILVGNNISETEYQILLDRRSENVLIERNRSDFLDLMSCCTVSISQAGYNTIMDILVTATKAVVIPFEGEAEKEQLIRAQALQDKGLLNIIREKDLSQTTLINAICTSEQQSNIETLSLNINGADQTASLIQQIISTKTAN